MSRDLSWWNDVIKTCQEIVRIPSPSGAEGDLANFLETKMKENYYDDVWRDKTGNLIGKFEGKEKLPSIGFSAHLDHVSPGNKSDWEFPPYSGKRSGGYIHGRGASDTKGAIATQLYIPRLLRKKEIRHGDIYVIFVVLEEVGGIGSKQLNKENLDYLILGEPTANNIRIGHRGRMELEVTIKGKSAHASVPNKAINPHFAMAEFISRFRETEMKRAGGRKSTAAPTLLATDQESSNVIPGKCSLRIDWRTVPGECEREVKEKIEKNLPSSGAVTTVEENLETYTGVKFVQKRLRAPYQIDPEHKAVEATAKALRRVLNREVEISWWDFGTDACFFDEVGIPVIGFSPCEEGYAHTSRDRVSLNLMHESLLCYPEIIKELSSE